MELLERAISFAAGAAMVLLVVYDLVMSVVIPRPSPGNWRISNLAFRYTWLVWRRVGLRARPEAREGILGSFAPLLVLGLLVVWVALLAIGYGLVLWSLRDQIKPVPRGVWSAVYLSGVSLLTIGFGDYVPSGPGARIVTVVEAGNGLGAVALVISLLFSLFSNFQRREAQIVMLDAVAGAPPSGLVILETARRLKMPELLDRLFDEWKAWSAEVLDSHLAYPVLNYFRSSHDSESWVSALGAVLDAATLVITTVDGERTGPAKLMFQVGTHLVEDLSHVFRFEHEHQAGVERGEFDEACRRLEAAGYRLRPPDEAWERFSDLRADYAVPLNEMAGYFAIPPAQWIGDRSLLRFGHRAAATAPPPQVTVRP